MLWNVAARKKARFRMVSAGALTIFSGKNHFYFAILENLRIFQNCLFTGGVWNELPQSKPDGFDSSLGEGAFGMAGRFLIASETLATELTACALSVKAYGFASSPKGRAKSTAGSVLIALKISATSLRPRLSPWESWRGSA